MKGTDFTEYGCNGITAGPRDVSARASVKSVLFIRALRVESSLFHQTNHNAARETKTEPRRQLMCGKMLCY